MEEQEHLQNLLKHPGRQDFCLELRLTNHLALLVVDCLEHHHQWSSLVQLHLVLVEDLMHNH
jgi:hypothetical protein